MLLIVTPLPAVQHQLDISKVLLTELTKFLDPTPTIQHSIQLWLEAMPAITATTYCVEGNLQMAFYQVQ
jgi:hypothetical protein